MIFRKAIHYFVFGNFLIAFSAVALTHLSQVVSKIDTGDLHLLVFVFFSTLLVYNLNMVEGMDGLKISAYRSERHNWIIRNEKFIYAFCVLSLIICAAEFFMLKWDTIIFLLVPGLFAVGYAVPVKLSGKKVFRLRDLPFIKIFLVAWVWATFTVGLPVVQQSGLAALLELDNFLLFFARAAFIFAITIPFDIRDLEYDRDKNVITVPSLFGIERSKYFSLLLLAVFAGISFVRFHYGFCSSGKLIALMLSAITTGVLITMLNKRRKELFYSFWMDGTMLVQWTFVMLIPDII